MDAPHRWRLDLAWDGGAYFGWQRQARGPTIQGAVEDALRRILSGESVVVMATGRTDAGVHALHQVAAFSCHAIRPALVIQDGLNGVLADDIGCLAATPMPLGFNPRHWTRSKTYRYRILNRRARCPFREGHSWHLRSPLDLAAMRAAATHLVGTQNFNAFRSTRCTALNAVRRVTSVEVSAQTDGAFVDEVHVVVRGNGFLRHQVRIMAGTLAEVGQGKLAPDAVPAILKAGRRAAAGETAPARGLWLASVEIGDGPRRCDEPLAAS